MRTLQQTEIKAVSGAGVLTSVLSTGIRAGAALGQGLYSATTIVVRPVASAAGSLLRFLI
jgi:hypothetical protein